MSNGSPNVARKSTSHFVAGLGSGVLSAALLQPIDLLKTRVQQAGDHRDRHRLARTIAGLRAQPGGLARSLYRGTVPSALRTGFGSAIYFTTLNAVRSWAARVPFLSSAPSSSSSSAVVDAATTAAAAAAAQSSSSARSSSLPRLSNTGNLLAGAASRAFAGFVLMPLTIIKVRYESDLYPAYRSVAGAARDILRTEGARGFFAGFGATALRDAPYAGLYVLFYEQSKKRLGALYGQPRDNNDNGTKVKGAGSADDGGGGAGHKTMAVSRAAAINFTSGVLAATTCSAVSNPFDAVKTRIQLQPARYRNMWHAASRMLAEEGVRSFWDGLALRMSRKALSSALAWTVYEEMIRRAEATWSRTAAAAGSGGNNNEQGVL